MFSERIARLTSSAVRDILAAAARDDVISFAGGLPAPDAMPELDWASVPASARQYGESHGEQELREAIAEYAREAGLECESSQVLVLSGSQQGIDLVSKLFIDPGTPVVTESPTYLAALQSFALFGARCVGLPLSSEGIDAEVLGRTLAEESPAFAYLIPTFQNPSGTCYSAQRRREVAAVLDQAGVPLFEDDPYRELSYEPRPRRPICAHLERTSWVYQGSLSKVFVPGVRVGYLIASPDLYPYLLQLKQATDLHTNRIGQWLVHAWMTSEDREPHLDSLRRRYAEKRDAMQFALERHLTGLATWELPPGGLFFWLKLATPVDTRTLVPRMLERGVAVAPGEVMFPGEPTLGHVRLNFSHATPEQLDDGVRRLAEELSAL